MIVTVPSAVDGHKKATPFEPFREQAQALAVVPKTLGEIATATAEGEQPE